MYMEKTWYALTKTEAMAWTTSCICKYCVCVIQESRQCLKEKDSAETNELTFLDVRTSLKLVTDETITIL